VASPGKNGRSCERQFASDHEAVSEPRPGWSE
jgi:hypothetical protein